jgi:hypothetical protein
MTVSHIACVAGVLAVLCAVELSAQPPPVGADHLLKGQEPTDSFAALQPLLASGQEIVVTDDAGRVRRGRLASLSGDQLVIASPVAAGVWEAMLPLYFPVDVGLILKRGLFRSGDRAFAEGSVRRIDVVDSTRNGTLIGAAVGVGIVAGVFQWERGRPDSTLKGVATSLAFVVGLPVSMRIGHVLDRAINKPIYRRVQKRTLRMIPTDLSEIASRSSASRQEALSQGHALR